MYKVIALVGSPFTLSYKTDAVLDLFRVADPLQCVFTFHLHGKAHRDNSLWKTYLRLFVVIQESVQRNSMHFFIFVIFQGHKPFFPSLKKTHLNNVGASIT